MNNKGFISITVVILISVIAIGLAVTAWYYEENKDDAATTSTSAVSNNVVNTNSTTNATVANTNTVVDPTADWQTYTNGDYGYSIKYPSDYSFTESDSNDHWIHLTSLVPEDEISTPLEGTVKGINTVSINIHTANDENEYSREQYYWAKDGFQDASTRGYNEKSNKEINGLLFTSFVEASGMDDVNSYFYVYDNHVIQIRDSILRDDHTRNESLINTFQFLPDTSGWQTYTNEEYGYTIKYPNSYRIEEGDIYINIYSYQDNILTPSSSFPQDEIKIIVSIYQDIDLELASWIDNFNINITKEEPFLINGTSAIKVWGTTEQMGATFNDHKIFYITSGTGVIFTAMPINSDQLDIFYKIVETFQFID